ncbi:aldo/keto reductase [Rhodotorula paludigena]|uniref:aldo/keto reductase n=1 Tax=Rhodotorula paludigena TaxID=86838 RepID=UPI00316F9B0B
MSTYADVKLPDGNSAPGVAFGVGTAHFGSDNDTIVGYVKTAIDVGFRHLDAAEAYGNETSVGKAIAQSGVPRSELFVTTKAGPGLKDPLSSFESSLKKLGLDYVDLYLIHWPYDFVKPGYPTIQEAWKALESIKDSGRARSIGVSNFRIRDLEKILSIPDLKHKPAANQIEFHPFMYEAGEELYQFCKKHDIVLEAYGPTSPVLRFSGGEFDGVLDKVTKAVAQRADKDKVEPSQVLLRLAAQRGAIVVTTSSKDWRMKEQLAAGALPELTQQEIDELVAAAKPAPQRAFMKHMDDTNTEY